MRIEHWHYDIVDEDGNTWSNNDLGTLEIDGNVNIHPSILMSAEGGGCGFETCHCSDGHWLTINFGRNAEDSTMSGVTVYFDNWGEMQIFLINREMRDIR